MDSIYRITMNVTRMKDSPLPKDCLGACVGVYVRSSTVGDAICAAKMSLRSDRFFPKAVLEAHPIDFDYELKHRGEVLDGEPDLLELEHLMEEGGALYGVFRLYSSMEDPAR